LVQWLTAIIRPKSRNSNIRHDGILSIGNFMLMTNNHFARFQLPGNLFKTKKMCSLFSWQHAISYLLSHFWWLWNHFDSQISFFICVNSLRWFKRTVFFAIFRQNPLIQIKWLWYLSPKKYWPSKWIWHHIYTTYWPNKSFHSFKISYNQKKNWRIKFPFYWNQKTKVLIQIRPKTWMIQLIDRNIGEFHIGI
jgi:hypothetical protein